MLQQNSSQIYLLTGLSAWMQTDNVLLWDNSSTRVVSTPRKHEFWCSLSRYQWSFSGHRTIETRAFKNFNHRHFLDDVAQQPWNRVLSETNPEGMWDVWKNLFMKVVDKHAPLQNKRVSNKHSPRITYELTRKIHKRNYMKTIAQFKKIARRLGSDISKLETK